MGRDGNSVKETDFLIPGLLKDRCRLFCAAAIFVLITLSVSGKLLAQSYTLSGMMQMNTGETFPYKIVFTEENGNIRGSSYTFAPPQQTKSTIKGTIDRYERKIKFRETEITESRGMPTKAFMCLVNATLIYDRSYNGATLSGPVSSRQTDKTACTPGTLLFNTADELQPLFQPKETFDTVITMKKKTPVQAPAGIKVSQPDIPTPIPETEKITAGKVNTYDWYTDTLILDIWDGGNTDGDRVTIACNGKTYLERHYLIKEKKRVKIALNTEGINTLSILADNEGSDPPNTATMLLSDGDKKYSILAYNNMGQRAIIKIRKVK